MAKEMKVVYYSDEANDDFAELGIKRKPLGENFLLYASYSSPS